MSVEVLLGPFRLQLLRRVTGYRVPVPRLIWGGIFFATRSHVLLVTVRPPDPPPPLDCPRSPVG